MTEQGTSLDAFRRQIQNTFHARTIESIDNLHRNSMLQDQQERRMRITTQLIQTDNTAGIFGVSLKDSDISVISVLKTYLDNDFRGVVDKSNSQNTNPQDYPDATAQFLGVSKEAVQATVDYYHRNQNAFDAYFTYENALNTHDPLVDGNQPPSQLPLP